MSSASWNYEDKKKLVAAIKQCGTDDLEALRKYLPHRSAAEIRYLWEKYSKMAMAKRNREEKEKEDPTPINEWINILKKMKTTQVLDIIPRVLKYIALYEDRPEDKDVNLRECYLTLSQMTNGHVGKNLNPKTSVFFYQNLTKLAVKLKGKDLSKEKDFIGTIKKLRVYRKGPVRRTYSNKKQEKKLATNTILNPLTVPDELLKKGDDC